MAGRRARKAGSCSMIECMTCVMWADMELCKGLTEMSEGEKNELEQCVMVLKTCDALHDLLLPRFKQKQSTLGGTPSEIPEWKNNAVQVSTGTGNIRWKCRLCNLTFSREKAFVNHYFLQHGSEDTEEKKAAAQIQQMKCSTAPVAQEPKLEHFEASTPEITKMSVDSLVTNANILCNGGPSTKRQKFANLGEKICSNRKTIASSVDGSKIECVPNENTLTDSHLYDEPTKSSSLTSLQFSPVADRDISPSYQDKPIITMILKESDAAIAEGDAWIVENEKSGHDGGTVFQRPVDNEDDDQVINLESNIENDFPKEDQGQVIDLEQNTEDGGSKDDDVISVYDVEGVSCRLCCQAFKTSRNLQQHMSVVHASSRSFICGFSGCGQAFKTKGSLTRHHRRHTGN
ncbi:Zinc finger C2H2-type [Trinorchestia longiramus]|nr:Zinc finger C2H2-type [Trinorchestia longiramus]